MDFTSTQLGNSTTRLSATPLPRALSTMAAEMVDTRLNFPSSQCSAERAKRCTRSPLSKPRPKAASTS
jgi:hypothetical protein